MFDQPLLANVPVEVSRNHVVFHALALLVVRVHHFGVFGLALADTGEKGGCLLADDWCVGFGFLTALGLGLLLVVAADFARVFLDLFDDFLFVKTQKVINRLISFLTVLNCY